MAFDPVIQKYMSHFYDVHGTLHITVKPELTVALGWAKPDLKDGIEVLLDSLPVCLDIDYGNDDYELSLIHISSPRDLSTSRMPSSA